MVCHVSGTSMQVVTFLLTPGQESLCTWTPSNPARTAVQNQYNTDFGFVCSLSKIVKINLLLDQTLVYFYVLSVPIVPTSPVVPDLCSQLFSLVPIILTSPVVPDKGLRDYLTQPKVPIVPTSPVVPDDVSDEEYSVTYASVPIILTSPVVPD